MSLSVRSQKKRFEAQGAASFAVRLSMLKPEPAVTRLAPAD
jgi:hypothetical protein